MDFEVKEYYFDNDVNIVCAKDTEIIERTETKLMGIEKIPITFDMKVRVDKRNGEPVNDNELFDKYFQQFIDEYYRITGKISQKEIRSIREKIGISQRGLAHLVGWSKSTVERYEMVGSPNPANQKILESLKKESVVKEYFNQSDKSKFSKKDLSTLEKLTGRDEVQSWVFKNAKQIADWFVAKNYKEIAIDPANNDQISQMKLHKLVYFAQVHFAALTQNQFLFGEDAMAFAHGPVFETIRKGYDFETDGNGFAINEDLMQEILVAQNLVESDEFVRKVLNDVWTNYGIYTAAYLRNLTHQEGTSWKKNYDGSAFKIIPKSDIIDDFELYRGEQ